MTSSQENIRNRTIGNYLDALASSEPAPGGGSVAGLVGALAAGLGEMVVSLTRNSDPSVLEAASRLSELRNSTLASGAADEKAYGGYVRASKLPKSTDEEKAHRRSTMQAALRESAAVPLELAQTAVKILEQLDPVVRLGSKYLLSDAAIAITLSQACVEASLINVNINVPMIKDEEVANDLRAAAHDIEERAQTLADQLRAALADRK